MTDVISFLNFALSIPMIVAVCLTGIYLSIKLHFMQFTKLKYALKNTFGKALVFNKKLPIGTVTPFQALCTALSSTVGTGNIAGVGGAIALGGAGVVFWLIISAFLCMCIKYTEIMLAVKFRQKNKYGEYVGGPMYYIKNGLGKAFLPFAVLYALCGAAAVLGTGNVVQMNTICQSINVDKFGENIRNIVAVSMSVVVFIVLRGGMKRISSFTSVLVPFMAAFYIVICVTAIIINMQKIPYVIYEIIYGAFNPKAVTGGVVSTCFMCARCGFSRSVFSNEAGLGTGSIAHSGANATPKEQGYFGITEVFIDTIVICSLTAFVILLSGINIEYGTDLGGNITFAAFTEIFGGKVNKLLIICLIMFAFSSVIGWGFYGIRFVEFLVPNANQKVINAYTVVYCAVCVVGANASIQSVWKLSELLNSIMMIPNIIGILLIMFKYRKNLFA